MLEKRLAYNAVHLPWGMPFPNSLQPLAGSPALTFDQFCAQLARNGTNAARVKFNGANRPFGLNIQSFEPRGEIIDGEYQGQYNDWGGNLQALVEACREHGIGIHAIPFDRIEWGRRDYWSRHAWNSSNGGFLTDPTQAIVDPRAIDAAKRRIDALVLYAGDVICSWEVAAEFTYFFQRPFPYDVTWAQLETAVREQGVPWVTSMAQYIHSVHPAPVGGGNVDGVGGAGEFKNELHRAEGLDFALINQYGPQDVSAKWAEFRRSREYVGIPLYVEQYAPWLATGSIDANYQRDDDPFPRSKAHQWAYSCGEIGFSGSMRWPECGTDVPQPWWGVAHPNHAKIAGVTRWMASLVKPSEWEGPGRDWSDRITSNELAFAASRGDGKHLTAYCDWERTGPKQVRVQGLLGELCDVTVFNYLSGEVSSILEDVPVAEGTATFNVPTTDSRAPFYLEVVKGETPEPETERTIRVRAVLEIDGEPDGAFEGTLTEVL